MMTPVSQEVGPPVNPVRFSFKSARHVQRFVSIHDPIANLFHLRRDHVTASQYRAARSQNFKAWAEIAGARLAA
jgi:putative transposase